MFTVTSDKLRKYVEEIERLFSYMDRRLRNRRSNSILLSSCHVTRDCLQKSGAASDQESRQVLEHIFRVYRAGTAIEMLHGSEKFDPTIESKALFKETPDLFAEQMGQCESSVFNLYCAALLSFRGQLPVTILNESKVTGVETPDLRIDGIGYAESKDMRSVAEDSLILGVRDNLDKAADQLTVRQAKEPLPFSLVFIDVPMSLQLTDERVFSVLRPVLFSRFSAHPHLTFVVLSHSGMVMSAQKAAFPHKWKMIARHGFTNSQENLTPVKRFSDAFEEIITISPNGDTYLTAVKFVP